MAGHTAHPDDSAIPETTQHLSNIEAHSNWDSQEFQVPVNTIGVQALQCAAFLMPTADFCDINKNMLSIAAAARTPWQLNAKSCSHSDA